LQKTRRSRKIFMAANRTVEQVWPQQLYARLRCGSTRLSLQRPYVIVTGWRFLWHVLNRILYCSITKASSSGGQRSLFSDP
jgi:hypothetical protein